MDPLAYIENGTSLGGLPNQGFELKARGGQVSWRTFDDMDGMRSEGGHFKLKGKLPKPPAP